MEKFLPVTVRYSQGLIKTWLVPNEILVFDFARAAGRIGRMKSIAFGKEVDRPEAVKLAEQGATFFYDDITVRATTFRHVPGSSL